MDLALAVGGAFLSAFLQVAFDRIASSRALIEFIQGKNDVQFDQETLDKLEITLVSLSVVVEDAEAKKAKSPLVGKWLDKLKAAMHHADDLLDELNTQCLRLKLHYHFQPSDAELAFNSQFIQELMPDLKKITARLENFVKQSHLLGLQKFDTKEKGGAYTAPSSSVVDKSRIFGRDAEKEKLIQRVLFDGEGVPDVSVIAVTGMGGIGKTTLAQLVYDDERVKEKFTTRAWVCVSEEYDAFRVTKSLLMEVNSAVVDDKDDFNRLQVKLKDRVGGECFLIILDDIWNESYTDWDSLKNPLNHGSRGSKIVITTRNENIALMMQKEPFHPMQPIPEDQSWSLFESHAFDNVERTSLQEFEKIGKEIVIKCKGLPLAIKTVAGALRLKTDINEWHEFLSSEIWADEGDILPALCLSYMHLPSHLKCCFAFCALFPKDIPFDKDEVVLLWMANDLVRPPTQKLGCDYFDELKSRSFFEMVNGKEYLMHDLVNDLARSISRKTCIRLEDYQGADLQQSLQREKYLLPELLHFSYLATSEDTSRKFSALSQVHNLRTLLPIHQPGITWIRLTTSFFSDVLPRFQRIRSLTLSGYKCISVIPDSIGDLKHLRLLNLAKNGIRKLPNTIGKCMNLQTLILKKCRSLEELPQDMSLLINLIHLDVRGVPDPFIERMGRWLCILKHLQNLSILVDKIHGSVVEQLGKFQLCKSLVIFGLENVTFERAEEVELKYKRCIENLSLKWSGFAECSQDELNIFSVLDPHTNIKQLSIKGYRGTSFPNWLGDSAFSNMVSLSLQDCENCFVLPPFGKLASLKKLHISGMDVIHEVLYGNSIGMNHLEELKVSRCPRLVSIPTHVNRLEISDCPSISLSLQSSLIKRLEIEKCKHLEYPTSDSCNSCLESLTIARCGDSIKAIPLFSFNKLEDLHISDWETPKLFEFPNGCHQSLTALKTLLISNCNNILSFPEGGLPAPNLKNLRVGDCKKLKSLHDCQKLMNCQTNWASLSHLDYLEISGCEKMRILEKTWGLQRLSSLRGLSIWRFDNKLFPDEGLLPSNLKHLVIGGFPNLESLNQKGLQHLCSLQSLQMWNCPNLRYLPEEKLSSSLSDLRIIECINLESLPVGLTSSLSTLEIYGCPKLEARMEREKGEDCPKLSHIPFIIVDEEVIS
ncbi:antimicrobial response protein [Lithospermum erythrorhizon]|uniref:Antimicrobial response protein n=1 Tax=Lithospermum erythrorhizon TaxID=34254 RepID=A0AAV3P2Q0_LITER